ASPSQGEIDAGHVPGGLSGEVAPHQCVVGEGVDGEGEGVAAHADLSQHLLLGAEVLVLVVHDVDPTVGPSLSGEMTGGAGHPAALDGATGAFVGEEGGVSGGSVGTRVCVVVTRRACVHGCEPRVVAVASVTGLTIG